MKIIDLEMTNIRVHKSFSLKVESNIVGIVGPNTSGKTSILESVYLLSRGRSDRSLYDRDMISVEANFARAEATVLNSDKIRLFCYLERTYGEKSKKLYRVNDVARSFTKFSGNLKSILFSPEDIRLVLGSPSRRRDYLDSVFFQFDYDYKRAAGTYVRSLRQVNSLLDLINEKRARKSDLDVWLETLCSSGEFLQNQRENFFNEIQSYVSSASADLSNGWNLGIIYKPKYISRQKFEDNYSKILNAKHVLYGPHRDDFTFTIRIESKDTPQDLAIFGSRGQQRVGALIFKLAELEYVADKTEQRPILLLDDIFSELDEDRRNRVLSYIDKQQTFITTVDKKNLSGIKHIQLVEL